MEKKVVFATSLVLMTLASILLTQSLSFVNNMGPIPREALASILHSSGFVFLETINPDQRSLVPPTEKKHDDIRYW